MEAGAGDGWSHCSCSPEAEMSVYKHLCSHVYMWLHFSPAKGHNINTGLHADPCLDLLPKGLPQLPMLAHHTCSGFNRKITNKKHKHMKNVAKYGSDASLRKATQAGCHVVHTFSSGTPIRRQRRVGMSSRPA